jgi:thiamine biosynthesis lipoprotein
MATRFEVYLHGENAANLRAAAEEALDEIERLDRQLNVHAPGSEMSRLNAMAATHPVKVDPSLFNLLRHAGQLSQETEGAFDISVGPWLRCWGFWDGDGHWPEPRALETARGSVGWQHVLLDEDQGTVRFDCSGVMIDLGSIGKGYAIDRALEVLRDAGVTSGVVNGGNSTIGAIGAPPGREAWEIFLPRPDQAQALHQQDLAFSPMIQNEKTGACAAESMIQVQSNPLAVVSLRDSTLSVSAVWGRSFVEGQQVWGHVLDPRLGRPVQGVCMAAASLPSATESDAFSTALMVDGLAGQNRLSRLRHDMRTWVVEATAPTVNDGYRIVSTG